MHIAQLPKNILSNLLPFQLPGTFPLAKLPQEKEIPNYGLPWVNNVYGF